jgi:hypothetical protein
MNILNSIPVALMVLTASAGHADDLSRDHSTFVVTGNISVTNQPDKKTFKFTLDDLRKLPNVVVRTKTIWTPTSDFEGPLLSDILKAVGAKADAKEIEVKSLDNFPATIPIADFKKWEVILAHTQNGKRYKLSTKGPFWIMYPVDNYKAELDNNLTRTKIVWAVNGIVVH